MEVIDKAAIVAEIEKLKSPIYPTLAEKLAYEDAIKECKDIILTNSTKTKDVDLEKELEQYLYANDIKFSYQIKYFAKYFFELGLKAQKGK